MHSESEQANVIVCLYSHSAPTQIARTDYLYSSGYTFCKNSSSSSDSLQLGGTLLPALPPASSRSDAPQTKSHQLAPGPSDMHAAVRRERLLAGPLGLAAVSSSASSGRSGAVPVASAQDAHKMSRYLIAVLASRPGASHTRREQHSRSNAALQDIFLVGSLMLRDVLLSGQPLRG